METEITDKISEHLKRIEDNSVESAIREIYENERLQTRLHEFAKSMGWNIDGWGYSSSLNTHTGWELIERLPRFNHGAIIFWKEPRPKKCGLYLCPSTKAKITPIYLYHRQKCEVSSSCAGIITDTGLENRFLRGKVVSNEKDNGYHIEVGDSSCNRQNKYKNMEIGAIDFLVNVKKEGLLNGLEKALRKL